MRRTIAATILAAALGAAPAAQADKLLYRLPDGGQQQQGGGQIGTGQILGGLAALGALGFALNRLNDDDDDDDKGDRRYRDRRGHDERGYGGRGYDGRDYDGRDGFRGRGPVRGGRAAALPASCLHKIDNRRGPDRVFAERCLARNGIAPRSLPQACRIGVRARGRTQAAYAAPCLRRQGWRVARHR